VATGNLMGPKTVLNAVSLIKLGEVIELSHLLRTGMPISSTRRFEVFTKCTTAANASRKLNRAT
jgi:hypothetical protein